VLGFPLLLIPFAVYNMIAFIVPMDWGTKLYTFPLKSGIEWTPTLGDAFLVFSLLLLMFEFIKATNYGKSIVEHFLSILLAGAAAAEFVMVDKAGTSVFVLFVAICFVDLFAGFAASLRRARRASMAQAPYVEPPVRVAPVREPAAVVPVTRIEPAVAVATETTTPVVKVEPVQKIEP
jgi:hypothetical protein